MKIDYIKIHQVSIPFLQSIDHHLKKRKSSESIILALYTQDGKVAYGEGTPRVYVTGESSEQAIKIFQKAIQATPLPDISNLEQIKSYSDLLAETYLIPSIAAALETAMLDLLGQARNCSISQFLPSNNPAPFHYSGVLPFCSDQQLDKYLSIIKSLDLKQVKIKVGQKDDEQRLAKVRQVLGSEVDLRVDANRAWTFEEAIAKIKSFATFNLSCIEEPLQATMIHKLPALSKIISTPLLLDESVYTLKQAVFYAKQISIDKLLFNLKISKIGGLLRTAELFQFAQSKGITCQLGCNVGETIILSAAGRIFAQCHAIKYLEGSYASFFMADNLSEKSLSFTKTGKAISMQGKGLGISIDPQRLEKYSTSTLQIHPTVNTITI